ncbi:class I SAM-dependent methyltransferase [Halosimplex halophilum]|uniref:class I SAM-dependent methyltransferase n=1 Tax=Halosimplex halophilum TaxID=2559572 RepID=UPI00107EEA3D|nr:class I SAM-dependent methyltransferase [Halosimplex halophilum]
MTDATHDDTIDWHRFWTDADDGDRADAAPSAHHATDAVVDFLAETGRPGAFADVGCGPGHVAFAVAEAYPEADVVGYDAAEPVLAENRERARDRDADVAFERAVLPDFAPGRQFDVVFSYFTLCYVREVEDALRAMYDAVADGGYLVFNYQNRLARAHWRRMADEPDEYLGEDSQFDADRFEDRFRLLLDGENLLSYDRIHEALGTWPRSVWSVVDRPDTRWAWRHHPLVFVPK